MNAHRFPQHQCARLREHSTSSSRMKLPSPFRYEQFGCLTQQGFSQVICETVQLTEYFVISVLPAFIFLDEASADHPKKVRLLKFKSDGLHNLTQEQIEDLILKEMESVPQPNTSATTPQSWDNQVGFHGYTCGIDPRLHACQYLIQYLRSHLTRIQ